MAKKSRQPLRLHTLLGAVSYWGAAVRFLLLASMLGVALALNQVAADMSWWSVTHSMSLIYILSLFLLMDTGYVTIARSNNQISRVVDIAVLLFSDALFALVVVLPYFATVSYVLNALWLLISVLLLLSLRLVVGMSYVSKTKK